MRFSSTKPSAISLSVAFMMSSNGRAAHSPWMRLAKSCPHDVEPWKLTTTITYPGAANICAFQRALELVGADPVRTAVNDVHERVLLCGVELDGQHHEHLHLFALRARERHFAHLAQREARVHFAGEVREPREAGAVGAHHVQFGHARQRLVREQQPPARGRGHARPRRTVVTARGAEPSRSTHAFTRAFSSAANTSDPSAANSHCVGIRSQSASSAEVVRVARSNFTSRTRSA